MAPASTAGLPLYRPVRSVLAPVWIGTASSMPCRATDRNSYVALRTRLTRLRQEVQGERRGPGEVVGAEGRTGEGREVLRETHLVDETNGSRAELLGQVAVPVRAQTLDDRPVDVDPCGSLPVPVRFELRHVSRHAGHGKPRPETGFAQSRHQPVRLRGRRDLCPQW